MMRSFNFKNTKVGFIGSGNMAEALIKGVINSGLLKKSNLLASDIIQRRRVYIKGKYGVRVTADNKKIVRESDIIILAVKPQNVKAVLQGIAPHFAAKQSRLGVR
ncbi:MAG: NAD(P)-binding domain-containing protein, partial [Candidatus Omnitrophica bacterium]|nr:NAD(P)-binding domain-containing protein [Candidatus Omnitrophota bacterium]